MSDMEIIKKRVSLENFKSRINSQLPVVSFVGDGTSDDNNSWGQIPCSLTIGGNELRYGTMMGLYYRVMRMFLNADFFKYDSSGNKWLTIDYSYKEALTDDNFSFVSKLPYDSVPDNFIVALTGKEDVEFFYEYFGKTFGFSGLDFIKEVDMLKDGSKIPSEIKIPTVDIPVLLTSSISNLNIYKVYETEKQEEEETKSYVITGITGESKLMTLRKRKRSYDDNGNELPGIYNGTDKLVLPYQIGLIKNIQLFNEKSYGDSIISMDIEEVEGGKQITVIYAIGARLYYNGLTFVMNESSPYDLNEEQIKEGLWDGEGIWYKETYPYKEETIDFIIDGENKSASYESIDFDSMMITYNYDGIDFPRKNHILCTDIRYKSDSNLNGGDNLFMFANDKDLSLTENVNETYDVAIDRGSASAYERHLVLSEIKTFQDLELLRNNMFNI